MNWYDNQLCEICKAHWKPSRDCITFDVAWRESSLDHCRELRKNREARQNKNIKPKETVF